MADILISSGKAWLRASGFGVRLKIYAKQPGMDPIELAETPAPSPGNGTLGSGSYAPAYIPTVGVGTYKIWAEHPDNAGVKSNEKRVTTSIQTRPEIPLTGMAQEPRLI